MFNLKAIPIKAHWILWGCIIVSIWINVFSLNYSPLPWFDEVFFASVSQSVATKGKMLLNIYPGIYDNEITTYGPVYFWLQGQIIKALGLDIFTFRLLNFASGLFCLVIFFNLVAKWQPRYALFFTALLFFDPVYVQNLHSGRMDLLVLLFTLSALWLVLNTSSKSAVVIPVLTGLLLALAYLTSPRAVFAIAPLLLLIWNRKGINAALVAGICFVVPVAFYITNNYENLSAYWHEFTNNKAVVAHIGPKYPLKVVFRYWHHALIYLVVMFALVWYMVNWKKVKDWSLLFLLTTIVLFHLLVVEKGPYTAMISPFYGLCLAAFLKYAEQPILKNSIKILCVSTIVLFVGYFTFKQGLIINQRHLRNPKTLEQELKELNLKDQKIIASFEYYYGLEKLGSQYIGYEIPISVNRRVKYHLDSTQARFMLLSQKDLAGHQFQYYMRNGRIEKVKAIHMSGNLPSGLSAQISFLRPYLPYMPTYEGTLFRIVPQDKAN
jgi:hypothetical protein